MRDRRSTTFLLAFSVLFGFFIFLTAAACGIFGFIQLASSGNTQSMTSILLFVLGLTWCGLLLLPGIWFAIQRLQSRPEQPGLFTTGWAARLPYFLMLLVYPLVLFVGSQLSHFSQLAWWVLPFLQIPAATLPVFWLAGLALRRFAPGSRLQHWGIFSLGLTLGPGLILVIELSIILFLAVAFVIVLSSDQTKAMELLILAQRLQYAQANPAVIMGILEPYLLQPAFLMIVFGFIAVLVPLVEETLKPIGVWLLAGRDLNPAQGFAAGVLSGAGYALFENLFITAPGEQWALISIGRIGTTTMHILTAGLTGYALAGAWSRGRYLRLGAFFGLSVLIHALWNGLTVLSVAATLQLPNNSAFSFTRLGQTAGIALFALYILVFAGLIFINRRLRRYAIIPPPESEPPQEDRPLAVSLPESAQPDQGENEPELDPPLS